MMLQSLYWIYGKLIKDNSMAPVNKKLVKKKVRSPQAAVKWLLHMVAITCHLHTPGNAKDMSEWSIA